MILSGGRLCKQSVESNAVPAWAMKLVVRVLVRREFTTRIGGVHRAASKRVLLLYSFRVQQLFSGEGAEGSIANEGAIVRSHVQFLS